MQCVGEKREGKVKVVDVPELEGFAAEERPAGDASGTSSSASATVGSTTTGSSSFAAVASSGSGIGNSSGASGAAGASGGGEEYDEELDEDEEDDEEVEEEEWRVVGVPQTIRIRAKADRRRQQQQLQQFPPTIIHKTIYLPYIEVYPAKDNNVRRIPAHTETQFSFHTRSEIIVKHTHSTHTHTAITPNLDNSDVM